MGEVYKSDRDIEASLKTKMERVCVGHMEMVGGWRTDGLKRYIV